MAVDRPDRAVPARVLVVDDDPQIRQMLQWALEDEGLAVEVAADGDQALASVAGAPPRLVILDMGLPGDDGARVAARLRERCGADLPVLLITADGHAPEKAKLAGAFSYFHKPFEVGDLLEVVTRHLE